MGLQAGNGVVGERPWILSASYCLLPSSVSEELKGEGEDQGALPNDVFGVWGKGNPPAIGFDDGGH